jgi:hypothetical protein
VIFTISIPFLLGEHQEEPTPATSSNRTPEMVAFGTGGGDGPRGFWFQFKSSVVAEFGNDCCKSVTSETDVAMILRKVLSIYRRLRGSAIRRSRAGPKIPAQYNRSMFGTAPQAHLERKFPIGEIPDGSTVKVDEGDRALEVTIAEAGRSVCERGVAIARPSLCMDSRWSSDNIRT